MESLSCPSFNYNEDDQNAFQRWSKWLSMFENYLVAIGVNGDNRQKALLLHLGGEKIREVYREHEDQQDTFDDVKTKLNEALRPNQSSQYAIYEFRSTKQRQGEKLSDFVSRLRTLAIPCQFTNNNLEIISQIAQHCTCSKIRRKILAENNITLAEILTYAHTYETVSDQVKQMETESHTAHAVHFRTRPPRPERQHQHKWHQSRSQSRDCPNCGLEHSYDDRCSARGKRCSACNKLNHFARVCRSNPHGSRLTQRRRSTPGRNQSPYHPERRHSHTDNAYHLGIDEIPTNEHANLSYADFNHADIDHAFPVFSNTNLTPRTDITINGSKINVLIDTGASINILNTSTFQQLHPKPNLYQAKTLIFAYNAKEPLKVIGTCVLIAKYRDQTCEAEFAIIDSPYGNLLSFRTASSLGLVQITFSINPKTHFPNLFENRIGKIKNVLIKLHIDPSIKPVIRPHCRIPFNLRKAVERQLKNLLNQDIIELVVGPTTWVSPALCIPKPNDPDEIRLVTDAREANIAILRERHICPTIDDILYDLNGAKFFTKIDLKAGYHQLELHPESRHITTFSTHVGLFRYKRLNFGIASASEIFQNIIHQLLHDIPGTINVSDDILVHGNTEQIHDDRVYQVLKRLSDAGATISTEKFAYKQQSIKYFGLVFTPEGVRLDDQKIGAIKEAQVPETPSELRSLLSLSAYCNKFIPNLATIDDPLREMLKGNRPWRWGSEELQAFEELKTALITEAIAYFKPDWITELIVDASPVGLGAVLTQVEPNQEDNKEIVAFASRALSDVEKRYSHTEKEGLACVWGCERFHLYLFSRQFTLITDNKPIELILRNPNSKPPARIQRWNLRLSQYNFTIKHRSGHTNIADYLSRQPPNGPTIQSENEHTAEEYINFLSKLAIPNGLTMERVATATKTDTTLQKLKAAIQKNETLTNDLSTFKNVQMELAVTTDGLIMRGERLVLPLSLQKEAVEIAHEGHQGIVRTKQLLREKVWFPYMDELVEQKVSSCHPCQIVTTSHQRRELHMSNLPDAPWHELSLDFYGPIPTGGYLLVLIDDYSRFPIVEHITTTSAKCVKAKLEDILSAFGVPKIIKTDNGPPFNSNEFHEFATFMGFKHRKITPYWPQANGEAERFMQVVKKAMKTAQYEDVPWKEQLNRTLRNYRATPHASTKIAPSTLLYNRNTTARLPQLPSISPLDATVRANDTRAKATAERNARINPSLTQPIISKGMQVLVKNSIIKNKHTAAYNELPLEVIEVKGSMVTAKNHQRVVTRDISQFKPFHATNKQTDWNTSDSDSDIDYQQQHEPANIQQHQQNLQAAINRPDFRNQAVNNSVQVPVQQRRPGRPSGPTRARDSSEGATPIRRSNRQRKQPSRYLF